MACNHSTTAVDTCNNGDAPLAVVVSQGMGDINTAHSTINGIFRFEKLPVELQNKIIGYAMLATDHEIKFPCLTNAGYTPNITVGLLLVSHRIYHEAHYQLRKQNTFIFGNLGSDLKTIASSIGPFKCRSGACGQKTPLHSSLAKVVFIVGDEQLPSHSDTLVHAFGCALRFLRSDIIIGSLQINLAYHAFGNSAQLSGFASSLGKIKVQDELTVIGDEKFLDMSFGDLPSHLAMNMMPVYTHLQAYNTNIQYSPGWFKYQYKPENHVGKDAGPQHDNVLVNSTYSSEAGTAIRAQLVG